MHRILIVEDHNIVREPLARLLRMEGFEVHAARNGVEALAALASSPFDLVLMDLVMPKCDGLSLLQKLHDHPHWTSLPVIVLTGAVEGSAVDQARLLTGDDVLFKSRFTVEELLVRIRQRLASRVHAAR